MAKKQNPTIFIGLGGHGSGIVNKIAEQVKRRPDWNQIQSLNHFIAIDTDMSDLQSKKFIPEQNHICISNFSKLQYQLNKWGKNYSQPDSRVTNWTPDPDLYSFRETAGAGAGQIRLESRLGVYYNLENESAIEKVFRSCIQSSIGTDNSFRRDDQKIRFFIFGSVAGGTGSGAFIPLSYFAQAMVDEPWTPKVTMFLSLPTLFREKVGSLYKNVCINGHAALKELEYLTRKTGYDRDPTYPLQFSHAASHNTISTPPASLVYLIDRPAKISIDDITQAIADSAYLLVYTAMLSTVEGELDNFEREAKSLAIGSFSTRYGVMGSHVIQFPREDIIEYASRRQMVDILTQNLAFSGKYEDDEGNTVNFSVNYDDPNFKKKSESEQNKEIDNKFLSYIDFRVQEEKREERIGMYRDIQGTELIGVGSEEDDDEMVLPDDVRGPILSDGQTSLWDKLFETTSGWMTSVENKIAITMTDIDEGAVSESRPSISSQLSNLRQEYADLSDQLRKDAESKCQDIQSGNFFRRLFRENKVSPIAQRFFLIQLLRLSFGEGKQKVFFIPPFIEGAEHLAESSRFPPENLKTNENDWNKKLVAAADQGLVASMFTDRDNKKFKGVRRSVVSGVTDTIELAKSTLRADYWKQIEFTLKETVNRMVGTFRQVGKTAFERLKEEQEQAERFLENPASVNPNAQVAQFHVYAEALRDDRKKQRLWGDFYVDKFAGVDIDEKVINNFIVDGFSPVQELGQSRSPGANEVVQRIKGSLLQFLKDQYRSHLNQMNMNVEQALILEAQYLVAKNMTHKPGEPDSAQVDIFHPAYDRNQRNVLLEQIRTKPDLINQTKEILKEKILRVENEVAILGNVPAYHLTNAENKAQNSIYFALDSSITRGNAGNGIKLASIVKNCFDSKLKDARDENGVSLGEGQYEQSGDPDKAIFFWSMYNIPIFALENVGRELEPPYKQEREKQAIARKRGEWTGYAPSHIEWAWETDQIPLIDLNPMEMKAAEERRRHLEQLTYFFKGIYFNKLIEKKNGAVYLSVRGSEDRFGDDRLEAYQKYTQGDRMFRDDERAEFIADVENQWKSSLAEIRSYPGVIERLETHLNNAKDSDREARRAMLDSLSTYFQDEADVIQSLISDLQLKLKSRGY